MTQEQAAPPVEQPAAEHEQQEAVISAQGALRLILLLLAIWTVFSALALIVFQDGSAATIGGGLDGGEGAAAKRLLGVHLLVLAPIYGLLAWEPQRYRLLLWVPYVAQGGVVIVTAFDIATGDRGFADGVLPLLVACVFLALLVYVWYAGRITQPQVTEREDGETEPQGPQETAPAPPPGPEDIGD